MRVLILTDPLGGEPGSPGAAVSSLARELLAAEHDVHVIAKTIEDRSDWSDRAERVPDYPPMIPSWDQISGALHAGLGMLERGIAILDQEPADVIHAHDWTTAYPAVALHRVFASPLVTTFSEAVPMAEGRGEELIRRTARWLASESTRLIVRSRSRSLRKAIVGALGVEATRIDAALAEASAEDVVDVYERAVAEASPLRGRFHGAPVRSSRT